MIKYNYEVSVNENRAKLNKDIFLFRGNRNIHYYFSIKGARFAFEKEGDLIEKTNAINAAVTVIKPNNVEVASAIAKVENGKIHLKVTEDLIDEEVEVGDFDLVFDLFDDTDGAVTIPKVIGQFHVLERPCTTPISELVATNTTNEVDQALTDYAIVTYAEPVASTNADGTFAKKTWVAKEKITTAELNRMEEGISDVSSQCKDIAKQLKDITTTGFTMIDVSSEDTYSINTGSTGGNTGETTIHVTGITITGQKNSLKIGETLQLTANIIPSNATNKNVEWTSTVVNYATVSDTGLVTAKDKGSVTIEATTEDGQFVARYNITIVADTTEGNNLIFELNSDDYTENSTTWTDSIRKIPCTLSAGVTKDATKGLLFTGKEKYETDISSLNISGNDAFTLIIEHTPTDNSGTFLSLLGLYTENDAVEKTLFEYRGFVSSDCLNYCGLSRVKLNHNVNERSVTGVSFGAKGSQVMVGNSNSINANKPTNSFDIPALLTSLKMAKSDNSNYYKGYIKSIRLYNKAMTEDEFKLVLGVNN